MTSGMSCRCRKEQQHDPTHRTDDDDYEIAMTSLRADKILLAVRHTSYYVMESQFGNEQLSFESHSTALYDLCHGAILWRAF